MAEKELEELLHRRDVELPLVEKELQKEMKRIKKSLENVERERKALNIKIDTVWGRLNLAGVSSTKTILDVPQVQWGYIRSEFLGQEHHLHNACLASADLESLITKSSPATKLKILGEKVFSVLVKNYYLNGGDLMSCLKSDSKDIETFAGMSWWLYLQSRFNDDAKMELEEVKLMSLKCIQDFRDKANQERNRWILFRNKHFTLESRRIGTKAEYEIFWNAALALLKEFGGFIISLQIKDNSAFAKTEGNSGISDVDLSLISRMKFFETRDLVLLTHLNKKTLEPFFQISADYNKLGKSSMFNSVRQSITMVSIDSNTPDVLKANRREFAKLAKVFYVSGNDLMISDIMRKSKAETVVFRGFALHPMWSISLLKDVPHLKEVILDIDWPRHCEGIEAEALGKKFPTVRNLTWKLTRKFPGSMDSLPEIFPNLRRLKLECVNLPDFATFRELMAFWNEADIFDEYAIDAFHLYTENMSLRESNIWNHFDDLKLLCVQSVNVLQPQPEEILAVAGEGAQRQMYFGRHEIYTRMENGSIRFENVIAPID